LVYSDDIDLTLREKVQSYIPSERTYDVETAPKTTTIANTEKDPIIIEDSKSNMMPSPEIIIGDDEYDPFAPKEYDPIAIIDEDEEKKDVIEYDPTSVKPLFDDSLLAVEPEPGMDEEEPKGQELDDIVQRLNNGFLFCQRFKYQLGKLQKKQNKKYFENFLRVKLFNYPF
jgi:hypothetical protein